jgi:L-lactate permease
VFIVGSNTVFRHMFSQLQQTQQWVLTMAVLDVMTTVAKNILPE